MTLIIPRTIQRKSERGAVILGAGLNDVREENFCLMVCDGISLALAFQRAGFKSANPNAATNLFHLDRVQKRTNEILEARRTTGVVTLGEVTDMLHRVFVGAWHKEEYSAAHNAAFSLARLYGHVTDKSVVEVIRRPSRDPDAPSEQALSSWVNSLPILEHDAADAENGQISALPSTPADLLGMPPDSLATIPDSLASVSNSLDLATPADTAAHASHSHLDWCGKPNDFNGLELCSRSVQAGGRSENGAPARAVTGTPSSGAHSELLGRARADLLETGTRPHGGNGKGAPVQTRQVPGYPPGFEWPSAEELF